VDPFTSVPPERVELRRSPPPRPESFLPPRALPAATSSGALIGAAAVAAASISNPLHRAGLMLLCGVAAWAIGYFTPPPRRRFRRDDDAPR
jgi:hypothetical protein